MLNASSLEVRDMDCKRRCVLAVFMLGVPMVSADEPQLPAMPRAVSSLGAAMLDGWLYVYGGHRTDIHKYSTEAVVGTFARLKLPDGAKWDLLPEGPSCQGTTLVAHAGKLYRIGGMQPRNKPGEKADNHSIASAECFDPKLGKWEKLPDMPAGRSSHDAVSIGDLLVVVGGWDMRGKDQDSIWHDTCLVLDTTKKPMRWEPVPQPFQRRALTATAFSKKAYVFGGMDPKGKTTVSVAVFDPATKKWGDGPELPGGEKNGFSPASAEGGGFLYVSPLDGVIYKLDGDGKHWTETARLAKPRMVHRLVADAGNRLWAIGGATAGEMQGKVEPISLKSK